MEQRKNNPLQPENNLERRTYIVEMRVAPEGEGDQRRSVSGLAPKFNSPSEIMYLPDGERFVEYFDQYSFRQAIDKSDPRALRDHIPSMILGRKSSNTLQIRETDLGLTFNVDLPNTTYANDLAVSMERGDVRETSFAFTLKKDADKWSKRSDGIWERRIPADAVDQIFDISIVTYPAYPDSEAQLNANENVTVAYRSLQNAQQLTKPQSQPEPTEQDRLLDLIQRKMRKY